MNADAGESEADLQLFETVTTISLASGGHAGDRELLLESLRAALTRRLAVGAHPAYADQAGFGRIESGLPAAQISGLVGGQLDFLDSLALASGAVLGHVKAHGALYNRLPVDDEALLAFATAVATFRPGLRVFLPAGPRWLHMVRLLQGIQVRPVPEAFPDRRYLRNGSLAPRDQPGAVLTDPLAVAEQALRLALRQELPALDGGTVQLGAAATLCLHADHPDSAVIAVSVRAALETAGFTLRGVE